MTHQIEDSSTGRRPTTGAPASSPGQPAADDASQGHNLTPGPGQHGGYSAATADAYPHTETLPIRQYAEIPTLLNALGNLQGASVLDLACGTGILSRVLADHGATVVGVDASQDMIHQARASTGATAGDLKYLLHDIATMPHLGTFDAITAGWLLNHAPTRDHLNGLCHRVAEHLGPGRRFVATLLNPHYDPTRPLDDRYGAIPHLPSTLSDGDAYTVTLHLDHALHLTNYFWSDSTCRQALRHAGFAHVNVRPWRPNADGIRILGERWWDPWISNPAAVIVTAIKNR
ncbi:hypothetical protein GCM10010411_75870 [Actinomadura fulvescens]|uniref:Methyltransferase domain-containing protein n=1 Tax=Actinomadura fulvescens TaxID=46160 RepID=A0ABN3QIZ2_9ACTN